MKKVIFIFGTRPEAIKLAPVIETFKKDSSFKTIVCITAQHREMLDQILTFFKIKPKYDLKIMEKDQRLVDVTSKALKGIDRIVLQEKPDYIIVQGDTTSAFAGALCGYYHQITVCHIEAGLRTNNKYAPFPEEINRRLISPIADLHFTPTKQAKDNLIKEGIDQKNIFLSGNTVIDTLLETIKIIKKKKTTLISSSKIDLSKKIILVTGHRRENFGLGFKNICKALKEIAQKNKEIEIVYPVHLNPNVQKPVKKIIGNIKNIKLIPPLDYISFVQLMAKAFFIITDSGGIQEEATSLGKPTLVMRETTERPEAVKSGIAKLVGTNIQTIVKESEKLLKNKNYYLKIAKKKNIYGNGQASANILKTLKKH